MILDRVAYRKAFWNGYQSLNSRFAQAVQEELGRQPGAVWIHDYHLALLPQMLKTSLSHIPMGVFWHIPWPGPEIFQALPERHEVLQGLLAADSLVFQTSRDLHLFRECAARLLRAEVHTSPPTLFYKGHRTRLAAHPISVDFRLLSKCARSHRVEQAMTQARETLNLLSTIRLGLGVDRLDYTKGLLKRLWALDTFFTRYPEYRSRFTFLQIAIPTRSEVETYCQYRDLIRKTVAELNARHSDQSGQAPSWRPILYHEGRIGLDTLLAYYRMADLVLVSSVCDGMNLVAKEYVAAQADESGVLLVSHMTGAADELKEAVLINPYDVEGMADAIKQALAMSLEERRRRMRSLRTYLATHDLHAWVGRCLHDIESASPES